MASKSELREQRQNMVINSRSKKQERALDRALQQVQTKIRQRFPGILLKHVGQWRLADVIEGLQRDFPHVDFFCYFPNSAMRPDGGIISIVDTTGRSFPILIVEKKNQGTNDLRKTEGKHKQSKGNAIERLGKNVIGFRTAFQSETIFPFVCFGDGCDFAEDSSILDRVVTIAQFGKLNKEHLHKQGPQNQFDRGTFYFREKEWSESEMADLSYSIAEKSVFYYFSKYGESSYVGSNRQTK